VKILLVTPEYPPDFGGGIVTFYRDLVPALRKQGCQVSVLKGSAFVHGGEPYEFEGVAALTLETARYHQWLERFTHFAMFPELRCHLAAAFALHEQAGEGEGFDAVEVTDWGLLFLPWVIRSKAPVLVQLHGSTGQIARQEPAGGRTAEGIVELLLESIALAAAPRLSSYSRANVDWWQSILHRPVNYLQPPLQLEPVAFDKNIRADKWISVARIQGWKGPQVACAAWELLGEGAPQLDWIGRDTRQGTTGESTDASLRRAFPHIWGRKIQPLGQLFPQEVQERMRAAKAVLVPSTWDVFNLAAAEAMALGKTVVISDGAGAVDLVQHGVNGFVFPKNDPPSLAELVRQVDKLNPEALRGIGQRASETVRDRLDPERIAAGKLRIYRDSPEPPASQVSWLRESLLPDTETKPFAFLDVLALKPLTAYVAQRAVNKVLGRQN
jgi:glycosyltransferase involved in cell wall biosynthesis